MDGWGLCSGGPSAVTMLLTAGAVLLGLGSALVLLVMSVGSLQTQAGGPSDRCGLELTAKSAAAEQ